MSVGFLRRTKRSLVCVLNARVSYWDRPRRADKQESLIKKSQSKGVGGSHVLR